MTALIKAVALADGMEFSRDLWVESYDVDAAYQPRRSYFGDDGIVVVNGAFGGTITLTPRRENARRFPNSAVALQAWSTISPRRPFRPDGKPNKPLTALTVEIGPDED